MLVSFDSRKSLVARAMVNLGSIFIGREGIDVILLFAGSVSRAMVNLGGKSVA